MDAVEVLEYGNVTPIESGVMRPSKISCGENLVSFLVTKDTIYPCMSAQHRAVLVRIANLQSTPTLTTVFHIAFNDSGL